MSFYTGAIKTLGGLARFVLGIKSVQGLKNIPKTGPALVCANHTAFVDPIILAAAMRLPIKFMGKAELFKIPVLSLIIRSFGAFPVRRGGSDVTSLKTTVKLLKSGEFVGMFPQGTRCPNVAPETTEVKSGAGLILSRAECNVIPVYIKTKNNKAGFFKRTTVIIGKPIEYSSLGITEGIKREYEEAANKIFRTICELDKEKTDK